MNEVSTCRSAAFFAVISCLFASCGLFTDAPALRARFERSSGGPLHVSVFVEGPDGQALSGANVVLTDPAGSSLLMGYEADSASFGAVLPSPTSGTFGISARSAACRDEASLSVPFTILSDVPSIIALSDAGGSDALSGNVLSRTKDIAIA